MVEYTQNKQITFICRLIDNAPSTEILESIMEHMLMFNKMNFDRDTESLFGMKILSKINVLNKKK